MLFKDLDDTPVEPAGENMKEGTKVDSISELKEKLSLVIEKVKTLKDDKTELERRVQELEALLGEKDAEISSLASGKTDIKDQISDLLNELDALTAG